MIIADGWKDYTLIDSGDGEKLEKWGNYILRRPDAQVIWDKSNKEEWEKADALYERNNKGGGKWNFKRNLPSRWEISYKDLKFHVEPTGFKHTGLFPEQAANWDWIISTIKQADFPVRVLNLFAYTGGSTVASSYAGAQEVCHVDAAKRIVGWAKDNIKLSKLENNNVRFFVDDVLKFVSREVRRDRKYECIIMDPPVYGRGPNGELWQIEHSLAPLIALCKKLLSEKALFFLVNCYTTGLSPLSIGNLLRLSMKSDENSIEYGEVGIKSNSSVILPCGIYGKWFSPSLKMKK